MNKQERGEEKKKGTDEERKTDLKNKENYSEAFKLQNTSSCANEFEKIFVRIIDQLTLIQEILVEPQYMSDIFIGTMRIVMRKIKSELCSRYGLFSIWGKQTLNN